MCCGEHNWPDSIPNFNGVLTLEVTLERFEGRNTVTQLVKGVVTTQTALLKNAIQSILGDGVSCHALPTSTPCLELPEPEDEGTTILRNIRTYLQGTLCSVPEDFSSTNVRTLDLDYIKNVFKNRMFLHLD
jgi:hypothetical protein